MKMKEIDPNWRQPDDATWHHLEYSTKLQLVPSDLHINTPHTEGRATYNFN